MKLTEKNITRLITLLPVIGIILATLIITFLIVLNDYKKVNFKNNIIRENFIKNEKSKLKSSINKTLDYMKYSLIKDNDKLKQQHTINFVKNILLQKDSYVFILNGNGKVVYHPKFAKGSDLLNQNNKDVTSIVNRILENAKKYKNGTYVTYKWNKINKSKNKKKTSYVYYFEKWNWVIGTGSYLDIIENQINNNIKEQEESVEKNILNTIVIATIIATISLILSFLFSNFIKDIFLNYKQTVLKKEKRLIKLNRSLKALADKEKRKSSKKEKEIQIMYKDRLTGLPNRFKLSELLNKIPNSKLLILNINRFTDINNFYSSKVADELLKLVAKYIVDRFKDNVDINIYKLPIDEYAILSTSENVTEEDFINTCKELISKIEAEPFKVMDNDIIVSITGGISLNCVNSYINADTALKIAKEKHKDFFILNKDDNVDINFQNNIKWTKILKQAVEEDRIVVFKQSITNNITQEVKYECLVRIKERNGNFISPYAFLNIAKKIKLYPTITRTVISKAFEHFKDKSCDFSINLTLDDIMNVNTVNFLKDKLEKTNIGKRVIFEIVESEGIDNYDEVSLFIKNMREYGCKIAIDDFGTGYSNFGYLMKLNVDFIKIDGSFIKSIDKDEQSQLITDLIITFAKKQNIETVAEFVQSEEVLAKVKSLGITYSQGYYLGEPEECKV